MSSDRNRVANVLATAGLRSVTNAGFGPVAQGKLPNASGMQSFNGASIGGHADGYSVYTAPCPLCRTPRASAWRPCPCLTACASFACAADPLVGWP